VDGSGNVFVADVYYNAVYEMIAVNGSIPASPTILTLGSGFFNPFGVAVDGNGNVFVAVNSNTALKEISPANFGSIAVGAASAQQTLTFAFDTGGTLASTPYSVLTQGAPNLDFAAAATQPATACVTGHPYNAGDTCTVDVVFTPKLSGARNGAVALQGSTGNVTATGYVQGTGVGPQIAFAPATQTQITTGHGTLEALAADGFGNLYLTDTTNGLLLKETLSGGSYTESTILNNLSNPKQVAVDGAGNIYVADVGNHQVLKETPSNGSYIQSVAWSGPPNPYGVAVDGGGNLYITDDSNRLLKETLSGGAYVETVITGGLTVANGIAVDGNGAIYIADTVSNRVLKETSSAGTYVQSVVASNLDAPFAVAVDAGGNVYVADAGANLVLKETPTGSTYAQSTVATLETNVRGVALDGNGNLYASLLSGVAYKLDVADAPQILFPDTTIGTTSGAQTVTLSNIGNAPLTFPIPGTGNNPSISGPFALSSTGSTACPLIGGATSSPGTLAVGATCDLPISFSPTASGTSNGALVVTDDSLNVATAPYTSQTITLTGRGVQPIPTVGVLTPNSGLTTGGTAVSITGTGFTGSLGVVFGATPASSFVVVNDTQLTAVSPAGSTGTVNVVVVNTAGASNAGQFTYIAPITAGNVAAAVAYASTGNPIALSITGGTPTSVAVASGPTHGFAIASGTSIVYSPASGYTGPDSFTYMATNTGGTSAPGIVSITVNKGQLNVVANGATMSYGGPILALSGTLTGAVPADGITVTYATDATATSPVGGVYHVSATLNDPNHRLGNYTVTNTPAAFTVTKATTSVTVGNLNQTYTGSAHAAAVTTVPGNLSTSITYNGASTPPIVANTYSVVATVTDPNYTGSTTGTLMIAKAGTTTALTQNGGTLSAQVASTAGIPTGMVSFYDGTSLLSAVPISGGGAIYATSLSGTTAHSLTAVYSGDSNFNASTSVVLSVPPTQVLDFTLADTSATYQTVIPGSSASFTYALSPTQGTYPGPVAFTVSGLPQGSSYTISPTTVAANAGGQTITLSVKTAAIVAQYHHQSTSMGNLAWALLLLPLTGVRRLRRSSRRIQNLVTMMLFMIAATAGIAALTGCGSGNGFFGQAPQNYTVTVTATAGAVQHASTVTLNMQ
jgi:sugar lactone lactonase YvrE